MPFQVLAVDFWNGNVASVQSFITAAGVTYPVLRNGGSLSTSSQYGIPYDNYVLVDAAGIVRYTSVNETYGALGRFNDTHLRAAIGGTTIMTVLDVSDRQRQHLLAGGTLNHVRQELKKK